MSLARFDGIQGYIEVQDYKGVTISGNPAPADDARSISFWVNTTQSGAGTVCYWGDAHGTNDFTDGGQNRVRLLLGRLELFGRGSSRKTASIINDGSLHHVLFTYTTTGAPRGHEDFSQANVYVDSVLDNGQTKGGAKVEIQDDGTERTNISIRTAGEQNIVIGALPTLAGGFTDFFDGDLDEFAIYDTVIDPATLTGIYNSGTPGADLLGGPQVPDLQMWYRMGDDVGDSAPTGTMIDQTAFGRDGLTSSGITIV